MSRGHFVDALWINRRMRSKDARLARAAQRSLGLQPEVLPFVDVEIVRSADARGPVVDVALEPAQPVSSRLKSEKVGDQ